MKHQKNGNQTRSIIAITLIAASFLSAFILSKAANQTELVWSARSVLSPGTKIGASEILLRRVAIPGGENTYIPQRVPIVNSHVLREIGAGELIPARAISADPLITRQREVPINILSSDSPAGLQSGQVVNIYHVGDPRLNVGIGPPTLILSHVYVIGIDNKSQNMGGNLSLTLSVDVHSILALLNSTSSGRLVVVKVNG
jgi:hypothetical protein